MYYHTITITLQNTTPTTSTSSSNPPPNPNFNPTPTPTSLASARNIADLIRIHRGAWSLDRMPTSYIQWITDALFTLLPCLDDPDNRDAFIGLCIAAKAFSRRWEATRTTLDAVQAVAKERDVVLPVETAPLFEELDKLAGVSRAGRRLSEEVSSETTNLL